MQPSYEVQPPCQSPLQPLSHTQVTKTESLQQKGSLLLRRTDVPAAASGALHDASSADYASRSRADLRPALGTYTVAVLMSPALGQPHWQHSSRSSAGSAQGRASHTTPPRADAADLQQHIRRAGQHRRRAQLPRAGGAHKRGAHLARQRRRVRRQVQGGGARDVRRGHAAAGGPGVRRVVQLLAAPCARSPSA